MSDAIEIRLKLPVPTRYVCPTCEFAHADLDAAGFAAHSWDGGKTYGPLVCNQCDDESLARCNATRLYFSNFTAVIKP